MLPKKAYNTREVFTHVEAHEDELNAYEQAFWLGREMFPGIATAPVILLDAGLHRENGQDGDYYLTNHGGLCIGVCGGFFDEHAGKKKMRQNNSAATRMAAWLGRKNDPGLAPLLEYSLRVDRKAGQGPFELPNLIKAWWAAGLDLKTVISLYRLAFRSLYRKFSGETPVSLPEPGNFRWLIGEWFVEEFAKADRKKLAGRFRTGEEAAVFFGQTGDETRLATSLDIRDSGAGAKTDFDLEGIWEAMVKAGVSIQERRRFVLTSLHAKYLEQLDFLAACRDFKTKASEGTTYLQSGHSTYQVAVIESGSRSMARAARFVDSDVDVLIQFRPDGSVAIRDLHRRLDMNPVAAQLRMAEREARGIKGQMKIYILLSQGTLMSVPQWFNWEEGHSVFNRTHTSPGSPLTRLTQEEVIRAVARGLAAIASHRVAPMRLQNIWRRNKKDRKRTDELLTAVSSIVDNTIPPDSPVSPGVSV